MKSIFSLRRATKEAVTRELAMPPGWRKTFVNQKLEGTPPAIIQGPASTNTGIQITDPANPAFGTIPFMLGYD